MNRPDDGSLLAASFSSNSSRTKRPDALLGLIIGFIAYLILQGSLYIKDPRFNSFLLPAVGLSAALGSLGLFFAIRGLIFFRREPMPREKKGLLLVIMGLFFTIPCLLYCLLILFIYILFNIAGPPVPN
ncbi:MAG TPA: hypothetical protein VFN35_20300 [Ktedonobacteraceae bacterium]|nr:hypothetical protein [Ktedonobacteraceae bacterium]